MTEEQGPETGELSPEELAELHGEKLPARESMSVVESGIAIPIDPAAAADVLSGESLPAEDDAESDEATTGGEPGA
jgi:hypothetical protein